MSNDSSPPNVNPFWTAVHLINQHYFDPHITIIITSEMQLRPSSSCSCIVCQVLKPLLACAAGFFLFLSAMTRIISTFILMALFYVHALKKSCEEHP